jgi:hypothetical protein
MVAITLRTCNETSESNKQTKENFNELRPKKAYLFTSISIEILDE